MWDLPVLGPVSETNPTLRASDWWYKIKPLMADLSSGSAYWWDSIVSEAQNANLYDGDWSTFALREPGKHEAPRPRLGGAKEGLMSTAICSANGGESGDKKWMLEMPRDNHVELCSLSKHVSSCSCSCVEFMCSGNPCGDRRDCARFSYNGCTNMSSKTHSAGEHEGPGGPRNQPSEAPERFLRSPRSGEGGNKGCVLSCRSP